MKVGVYHMAESKQALEFKFSKNLRFSTINTNYGLRTYSDKF